jgi:signal transduction histidine kinase/CheY-like chemotaxis protein
MGIGQESQQQRTLYVGIDRNAPPIEFEHEGKPDGFNIDIMNEVGTRISYKIEYIFMEWTAVLNSVENGTLDVMFALKNPEREVLYDFSHPIINITWKIVVRDDIVGIANIDALANRTVAVVRDFAELTFLNSSVPGIIIIPVDSTEEGLQMVADGNVFAFFGQEHMINYHFQKLENPNIKFIGESYPYKSMCITVKKGRSDLLNQIDTALMDMFNSGDYERIHEKWYGKAIYVGNNNQIIIQYIIFIFIGIGTGLLLLLIWNYGLQRQVRIKTAEVVKANQVYRILIELLPFPAAIVDQFGNVEYINPKVVEALKYSLEEIDTTDKWLLQMFPDASYRDYVKQQISLSQSLKDEKKVPINEFTFRTKDGRDMRFQYQQIHFDEGKSFIILNDMSEHYQLENELLRKQKLDSLSLMAGGLAHDFNNILMGIIGNVNLIQLEENLTPDVKEILENVEKSIIRAKSITAQLLTFSKGGSPMKKPTAIKTLVNDAVDFSLRGSNCKAEVEIEPDLPLVNIDEGQITQVLNNLIVNATQAMPNGGTIQIRVESKYLDENNSLNLPLNEYILITVTDHGCGIPIQLHERIFTPYFTTKEKGNGLGLAMSYSIIQHHGGLITFSSTVNKGTTFFIYLPTIHEIEKKEVTESQEIPQYSGRILILEDDPEIIKVLSSMLTKLGFEITLTSDGNNAIGLYQKAFESDHPFRLVILDLTIPGGLGGKKTLEYLKQINPEIIAIVSSGYSDDPTLANFKEYGFSAALKKPYNFKELINTIAKLLNSQDN